MAEDKKLAAKMVRTDARNTARALRQLGVNMRHVSYEHGLPADLPNGNGEGSIVKVTIGTRDELTKTAARKAAKAWRQIVARYPKAIFYPHLLGYDQDPREIWEIVDAARYVRWFARYSGLDDMETALRIFGPGSPTAEAASLPDAGEGLRALAGALGFFAGCGVFGDDFKQIVLRRLQPTPKQ